MDSTTSDVNIKKESKERVPGVKIVSMTNVAYVHDEQDPDNVDRKETVSDQKIEKKKTKISVNKTAEEQQQPKPRSRNVKKYYHRQADLLKKFEDDAAHVDNSTAIQEEEDIRKGIEDTSGENSNDHWQKQLIVASFGLNVLLLAVKLAASVLSGSLSIVSSLVDTVIDIVNTVIIFFTSKAIKRRDNLLYPRGRTRLEPLTLLIVSVVVAIASFQLIINSIKLTMKDIKNRGSDSTLVDDDKVMINNSNTTRVMTTSYQSPAIQNGLLNPYVDWVTVGLMLFTVLAKLTIMIVCFKYQNKNTNISLLAKDHRRDAILNVIAIMFAYLAYELSKQYYYMVYLDPIGAVLIALYIATTFAVIGYQQSMVLTGYSADITKVKRILKIAMEHDKRIKQIETGFAYHFGSKFLVELHIVLSATMRLHEAHDISEPLQRKIEYLPFVERCFVHSDYEVEHRPEDEHKVV